MIVLILILTERQELGNRSQHLNSCWALNGHGISDGVSMPPKQFEILISVGLQYILYSGEKRIAGKGIIRYC